MRPTGANGCSPATDTATDTATGRVYAILDTTQLLYALWLSELGQAARSRAQLSFRTGRAKHH